MAYRFSLDDVRYLSDVSGARALELAAALPLTDTSLLADVSRLRRQLGERAAAVAETIRLRRRAVVKLGTWASDGLFTDEALQQATPEPVARHRARRLRGVGVHDLTCSVGSDLVALVQGGGSAIGTAIGSDIDPVRVLMARHNLVAAGLPARVVVADALTRTSWGLLAYADPARRDGGGRRITSASTVPAVDELDRVHRHRPPVLRVPPGIDYDSLRRPGEVEIVSLDGSAREAVLWPPELGRVARRATVLSTRSPGGSAVAVPVAGGGIGAGASVVAAPVTSRDVGGWELTSEEPDDVGVAAVADYLVDPDPAVVRAHLVRHYAARHGLWLLDPHLAYLTGPVVPAGVRGFRVIDTAPYRERTVAGWARRDAVGTLEIKQRGTALVPDDLRRRLRPALIGPTSAAATLVVARIGRDVRAFWCRPVVG